MASHDDKGAELAARQAAKFAQHEKAEVDRALGELFGTHHGRRALWWLLQIGKVGTQPFQLDPHATAFNCGELNVGNQILARLIEVNPIGYAEMQMERQNESVRNAELLNRYVASGGNPDFDPYADEPDAS